MNRRHILIATDSYNGKLATANGICVQHIAEEFLKHNYDVDVICYKHKNEKAYEEKDGIRFHRIKVNLVNYFRFAYESGQNRLIRNISKIFMVTLNRIQTLMYIYWFPMRAPFFCRRYAKSMEKLYKKNNYDIIIASYCPFEAAYAGWRTKKELGATVCLYSLDSLSNFSGNKFFLTEKSQREKGKRWEKKFFNDYDYILHMMCHQAYYECNTYDKYRYKFKYVDFPHVLGEQEKNKQYNKYLMMYVGNIRTSYFNQVIDLLEDFISDKYMLDIYGGNTIEDLRIDRSKMKNIHLCMKGRVDHNLLIQLEKNAGCFISMGNYGSSSNFVPSKIFEYISTGKKIIHFYKNPNDSCLPYLKKYKACCLINVDNNKYESLRTIEDFLESESGIVSREEIEKNYYVNTPGYTYGIINEYMNITYENGTIC